MTEEGLSAAPAQGFRALHGVCRRSEADFAQDEPPVITVAVAHADRPSFKKRWKSPSRPEVHRQAATVDSSGDWNRVESRQSSLKSKHGTMISLTNAQSATEPTQKKHRR